MIFSMDYRLSEEFLSPYKHQIPEWGPLGWETYKRTYARWIENEQRYEEWWETCKRVIEGNFNLIYRDPTFTMQEMELAYDLMFWLIWLPPGRGLWVSGTDFAKEHGDALINCWYISIRPQPYHNGEESKVSFPFVFIFDVSMKGGGSGFSARMKDVGLIPKVNNSVKLYIRCNWYHPDFICPHPDYRLDHNLIDWNTQDGVPNGIPEGTPTLKLEDSREGWCDGLRWVIDSHFENNTEICIDVSDIRPYGTPIKGFGGKASGPRALVELLKNINYLLNLRTGIKLSSVDAVDMMNMVGRCVIAGNVRRTAQLSLGDADDKDFLSMKDYTLVDGICKTDDMGFVWEDNKRVLKSPEALSVLFDEKELAELLYTYNAQTNHRWSSNNSLMITPEFNNWKSIADKIKVNGEPGFVNEFLIKNYGRLCDGFNPDADPEAEGCNACSEITLANGEACNLVEDFLSKMRKNNRNATPQVILSISTRYAFRVTCAEYDWDVSHDIIHKNRRIGVSLSGIQDWILEEFDGNVFTGWTKTEDGVIIPTGVNPELIKTLDEYYKTVKQVATEYAQALGVNIPIKFTTVKPSGTVSLIPGLSPGMHWHYFDYGIRRMRLQHGDRLLKIFEQCGYHIENDARVPGTKVVEFPVKAPTADHPKFRSAGMVPAYEQFAFQALMSRYWADNSVSCTVTFQPEEADQLEGLLRYYSDKLKSTSCLPYADHGYVQAPYEPYMTKDGKTPKQQYEEAMSKILYKPVDLYMALDLKDNNDEEFDLLAGSDCAGGACPIR